MSGGWRRAFGRRRSRSVRVEANTISGTIAETAYIGVATQIVVETPAGTVQVFAQNTGGRGAIPQPGARVTLSWDSQETFVVDGEEEVSA